MKTIHLFIALFLLTSVATAQYPPMTLSVGVSACSSITLGASFSPSQEGAWRADVTPQYSANGSSWTSLTTKSVYVYSGPSSQSWSFSTVGSWDFRWQVSYYYDYGWGYQFQASQTYNNNQSSNVYEAAVAGFNINGTNVSATSPYEGYGYGCSASDLILNNTSTGNANNPQWQLYYQECNSTGGGLTGQIHGLNTWQSGWLVGSIDLKSWEGGYLGNVAAVGKYYLITLIVRNNCNGWSSTKQSLIHVNSAPSAPGGVLRFNGGTSALSNQTASKNIASPNLGGCFSSSFNLASTTGSMFLYKAVIDQVSCSNGAFIQNIVNPSSYSMINGAFYTGIGINAVTNPTGYFGNNNCSATLNNCYKLTVYYGNQCAIPSDWLYFKLDGTYKTDGVNGIEESYNSISGTVLHLYPNPAHQQVTLRLDADEPNEVSINICDLTGRVVQPVSKQQTIVRGENQIGVDVSSLSPGFYYFIITNRLGDKASVKFVKN